MISSVVISLWGELDHVLSYDIQDAFESSWGNPQSFLLSKRKLKKLWTLNPGLHSKVSNIYSQSWVNSIGYNLILCATSHNK